jgi:hypothetical protein
MCRWRDGELKTKGASKTGSIDWKRGEVGKPSLATETSRKGRFTCEQQANQRESGGKDSEAVQHHYFEQKIKMLTIFVMISSARELSNRFRVLIDERIPEESFNTIVDELQANLSRRSRVLIYSRMMSGHCISFLLFVYKID